MAIQSSNKWLAMVKGVIMTDLVDKQWENVEFNSREDAERAEREYYEFWKNN